ncbi:MAG: transglycosylase SLT domain-containing protein [Candidatus Eremiobacteraeota bacterium]|nr:transglycosylase SLT domain-containing protein [Candidatus Eremiobacteraeota bacterium]
MSTIDKIPAAAALAQRGVAFASQIAGAAQRHGLDPRLLAAVAAQETGGPGSNSGRNVVGDGGHGRGLFQIDDRWHDFAKSSAAMDPARNADYAAGMLSGLIGRYGGNVRKALCAYNAGSPNATGTTTTWGDGRTLGYADSVMRHYTALGGAAPSTLATDLAAESQTEQASVNSLASFAALQIPPYCPPPTQSAPKAAPDYAGLVSALDDDDQR